MGVDILLTLEWPQGVANFTAPPTFVSYSVHVHVQGVKYSITVIFVDYTAKNLQVHCVYQI